MDFVAPTEHLCYVSCSVTCPFCYELLAVDIPCKPMEMKNVQCGHCNSIFPLFTSIAPMFQSVLPPEHQMSSQVSCLTDCTRHQPLPHSASSASYEHTSPKTRYVVKPPEKKTRQPSAYNNFMREEIQRIKAAKPDIPHREAFSMAAKNWARSDPRSSSTVSRSSSTVTSSGLSVAQRPISLATERGNVQKTENFVDVFEQFERKG